MQRHVKGQIPPSFPFPSPGSDQELMITCEFCGQFFDSRKALSCHARSHLRQLGVMWSVNESPIDLLRDILLKEGSATATQVSACMCAV